jgi:Domain of unknown function (DUF4184)
MPFTFSHPALVLPITYFPRKFYSLTGLVVGSMIPDFEYFLRMSTKGEYGHTLPGILWFDLPLALLVALIYHQLVRNLMIDNLPKILYIRLLSFKQLNWRKYFKAHWFVVCISIIIGTCSHLLWDSFTHGDGYFVKMMPALAGRIGFLGVQIHIFKLLQYGCSLAGGIAIMLVIFHLPKQEPMEREKIGSYWIMVLLLTFFILTLRLLVGIEQRFYDNLIISVIASGLLALILTSLVFKRLKITIIEI